MILSEADLLGDDRGRFFKLAGAREKIGELPVPSGSLREVHELIAEVAGEEVAMD